MRALKLTAIAHPRAIKGVLFPPEAIFRKLLVTGPPGCGKTTLINRIGGWPEEGYIDLTCKNWWANRSLAFRPREIHLGFAFVGHEQSMAVFDEAWINSGCPTELDVSRIRLPPRKRYFFSVDWRKRYVFEFLLPDAELTFRRRRQRARKGTHPVDAGLEIEQVRRQLEVFEQIALLFHHNDMSLYVRKRIEAAPMRIID